MRLQDWGKTCKEEILLNPLLADGAARIREESPEVFLRLVETWLTDPDIRAQQIGLRALPALILNPDFENLPKVYRLITPFLREVDSVMETNLIGITRALAKRSPQETAHLLQQVLVGPHKTGISIIVRRSLDVFPLNIQHSLRIVLREQMRMANGIS